MAAEVVGSEEEAAEPSDEPSADVDVQSRSDVDDSTREHRRTKLPPSRLMRLTTLSIPKPTRSSPRRRSISKPSADDAGAASVDEADEMPESEAPSDSDDLFIEDTPAPKRRRSSRKGKSTEKAPKRKAARGGSKGRHVVGLKIGASQIAAAVVCETDGRHELVDLARRPLAAGIVVDGEIRDLDALSNALKAFFDEEDLPKKDVRIGLASNRIGVRTFDIVGIDDEARFDNAVRFKAHEVLPVAAHESVLDYRVLEERPNEAGEPTRRVLLVVAPRDQVEPYAEVARRVGIKLSGIDLEALGLLRAFVDPKPFAVRAVDDTATVVVSIGHESSTLLVAGGGACEFTRVFDWGGGALEEAIASTLEVHPAEAATILRHLSLSGPGRQFDGLDEVARAKALDAVRLRLTPFARELVSSLQFYQTQAESLGIGGIVITGGTSHLEGPRRDAPPDDRCRRVGRRSVRPGHPRRRLRPGDRGSDRIDGRADRACDRRHRDARRRPAAEGRRQDDEQALDADRRRRCRSQPLCRSSRSGASTSARTARPPTARPSSTPSRRRSRLCRSRPGPTSTHRSSVTRPPAQRRSRAFSAAGSPGTRSSATWHACFPTNVWLKSLSASLPGDREPRRRDDSACCRDDAGSPQSALRRQS